jgi:hypothetical protein
MAGVSMKMKIEENQRHESNNGGNGGNGGHLSKCHGVKK